MLIPPIAIVPGMAIPVSSSPVDVEVERDADSVPWAALDPASKRERLLGAAERVFHRHGIDAPVPAIAAAAGVGVGSVYRAFASKDDILAALAVERLEWFTKEAQAAL